MASEKTMESLAEGAISLAPLAGILEAMVGGVVSVLWQAIKIKRKKQKFLS